MEERLTDTQSPLHLMLLEAAGHTYRTDKYSRATFINQYKEIL